MGVGWAGLRRSFGSSPSGDVRFKQAVIGRTSWNIGTSAQVNGFKILQKNRGFSYGRGS